MFKFLIFIENINMTMLIKLVLVLVYALFIYYRESSLIYCTLSYLLEIYIFYIII